jgi:CheY-like chemotaxis protein
MAAVTPRIVITLDDPQLRATVHGSLAALGWPLVDADEALADDLVHVIDAAALAAHNHRGAPLLAISADADTVAQAFALGADDVLRVPFDVGELGARVARLRRRRERDLDLQRRARDARVLLELTQALTLTTDAREILRMVVRRLGDVAAVERCSVVLARDDYQHGYVVASNDVPGEIDRPIELGRYPEIQEVLASRRPLLIDDALTHPLLDAVRELVSGTRFPFLALFPIALEQRAFGVLFLRASEERGRLDEREQALCETVANATAAALRNAREIQQLREERLAVSHARLAAERRHLVHEATSSERAPLGGIGIAGLGGHTTLLLEHLERGTCPVLELHEGAGTSQLLQVVSHDSTMGPVAHTLELVDGPRHRSQMELSRGGRPGEQLGR